MKRRPWPIILLALLHVLAPAGNVVLNSFRSGRSFSQTWEYWLHVIPKPLFLAYVVIPPIAGILIFICKRWSYWLYVGCIGLIFLGNVYGFWTSVNLFNFLTLMTILIVDLLAVAYFVVPSVRKIYFDPRMRWWETAPRYNLQVEGKMSGAPGFIRNIAEGGAFVESPISYSEGQPVELKWEYEGHFFTMQGKVVYQKPVENGLGCGVRFDHTSRSKNVMKFLIGMLHKKGHKIHDRAPGPEDSFGAWLKRLLVNREGLFPK